MSRHNRANQRAFSWVLLALGLTLSPTMLVQTQTPENLNRPPQDEDYLWWRLPASEQQYARIDGYRIKDHVRELTAIARTSHADGSQHWGSIAGQPSHNQMRPWIGEAFQRIGLDDVRHVVHDLDPQWLPRSRDVSVSSGGQDVRLASAHMVYGSPGTPAAGLDLEPVWLGLGAESDFIGREVRGKAAFIIAQPRPTARGHSGRAGAQRAVERGAAAIVWVFEMQGNPSVQPMGTVFDVPTLMIGLHDGEAVEHLIGQGQQPRIRIRADVEAAPGLRAGDVFGVLPGTTDETIVVVAHFDWFFDGGLDNASGVAGLVALAEYFAAVPQAERRRTMVFAGTCCHHGGEGLNGAPTGNLWMIQNMAPTLAKTALVVNMEHLSQTPTYVASRGGRGYAEPDGLVYSNAISARRWFVGGTDGLRQLAKKTFQDFGVALFAAPEQRPGGELGAFRTVAPSLHIIDHVFYHTSMDTAELVPASGLQSAVQAFAKIIDEVNQMDLDDLKADLYP
jgi:hypothetical protein